MLFVFVEVVVVCTPSPPPRLPTAKHNTHRTDGDFSPSTDGPRFRLLAAQVVQTSALRTTDYGIGHRVSSHRCNITSSTDKKLLIYTRLSSARGRGDTNGRIMGMMLFISGTLPSITQSKVTAFHLTSKNAATSASHPFSLGRIFSANLGVNERPMVSKFSEAYANA